MIVQGGNKFKVVHTTVYTYSDAVPICLNEVHLEPRSSNRQRCLSNRLLVRPTPTLIEHRIDYFGNDSSFFSIQEAHQRLTVTAISKVQVWAGEVPDPAMTLPWEQVRDTLRHDRTPAGLDAYQFVFDSPYIKASQPLMELASRVFSPGRPILEASLALTRLIHREFKYDSTVTNLSTPLADVLRLKAGVCQDFAHLQIGAMRSLGLAARYVSGYLQTVPAAGQPRLVGSDASHAWLSVWCPPAGWIDLDPTNNQIPSTEHITLAWGRDYDDVCPITGVFVGGGKHSMSVSVDVLPLESLASEAGVSDSSPGEAPDAAPEPATPPQVVQGEPTSLDNH